MAKNYDPRMHTAEHILNQTMDRLFACGRCFSAHVNPDKAKCDYHYNRDLTEAEARDVEARVNTVIAADLPVFAETWPGPRRKLFSIWNVCPRARPKSSASSASGTSTPAHASASTWTRPPYSASFG